VPATGPFPRPVETTLHLQIRLGPTWNYCSCEIQQLHVALDAVRPWTCVAVACSFHASSPSPTDFDVGPHVKASLRAQELGMRQAGTKTPALGWGQWPSLVDGTIDLGCGSRA
jgi:hypothetical protein